MTRPFRFLVALIALAMLAATGCDSQRINQFASFATAGSLYVQAFHKLIPSAGSAMIAADSVTLMTARSQAPLTGREAEFTAVLKTDDSKLETYLANLDKIDAHATLLGNYFASVAALSDGKEAASLVTATTSLATSLESIDPEIGKVKFAGKSVNDFVKSGTNLIVTVFEVKALNHSLQESANTIDKALAIQEAAIECIADQMKSSLGATLIVKESTDVINPFINPGPLPSSWNTNREAYLRTKVTLDTVDAAKSAMKSLHTAFQQLVANKTTPSLSSLLAEINKLAGYVSAIETAQKPANPSK